MTSHGHAKRAVKALAAAALVTMIAAVPAAHAARPTATAAPPLTIWDGTGTFTRNFNPFAPSPPDFMAAGGGVVYEPLYIDSIAGNKTFPWLATGYSWSKDLKTLTFTIRKGVKWSDGQPFTARDVYYTMMAGKKVAAMDKDGLWGPQGLASSVTMSGNTVSIHFKQANAAAFADIVNNLFIIPEHIWSKVKNPTTWTNPSPVGTGPFTEVKAASSSSFDVGRNPYYWQPLHVDAIRVLAYTGNDPGNLDLESGKIDWAGSFIPQADKLCEGKGMGCHHFYSTKSTPVILYFNDTKYPYSLPAFRKAVSMALNRQAFDMNAEYGYEPPATITGLNGQWASWIDKSVSNAAGTYNVSAAQAMLKKAGFTLKNGKLMDPKGHPVSFDVNVVTGWTDWIAMDQIISQNLKALGIAANPKPLQYGDYFSRESTGNFDVSISWACGGATPFSFYNGEAGIGTYKAIGTAAGACNFERYHNAQLDALLAKFRQTLDSGQQHALANQMQRIWANELPVIPMVIGAIWYEYNPTHYTGFPTQSNYYVAGPVWSTPDRLVVITRLRPTGH